MAVVNVTSIPALIANFPYRLDPIPSKPSFDSLLTLKLHLLHNASQVRTTLGGGRCGYAGLLLTPVEYELRAPGTPFIRPPLPPPPNVPGIATAAVLAALATVRLEALKEFELCNNVEDALRQILIDAIQPIYLEDIADELSRFSLIPVGDMLRHLFTQFGRITVEDLIANDQRMQTPWNPATPFQVVIEQLAAGKRYAAHAAHDISDDRLLGLGRMLANHTGLYVESINRWDEKPAATRTWGAFKTYILLAQETLALQQLHTTQQMGYHAANLAYPQPPYHQSFVPEAQPASGYYPPSVCYPGGPPTYFPPGGTPSVTYDNGPAAMMLPYQGDRYPPSVVTPTPDHTSARQEAAFAAIADLTDQVRLLRTSHPPPPTTRGRPSNIASRPPPSNTNSRVPRQPPRIPNDNYCWTHGYRVGKDHTSATCEHPAEGHQLTASKRNPQGGSTKNMLLPPTN